MSRKHSLKTRVVFSFLILGSLLSILFGIATLTTRHYLEDQLIGKNLQEDLHNFLAEINAAIEGQTDPSEVKGWPSPIAGYTVKPNDLKIVPKWLHPLGNGIHKITVDNNEYLAVVEKTENTWGYLTYDMSRNVATNETMAKVIILIGLAFAALSLFLGISSAEKVMFPVMDLARRIKRMSGSKQRQKLASHFTNDEVGEVASALDDYAERLTRLVERDKEFNADVSHELRTPLAVIQGATELLLGQQDLTAKTKERLIRVQRATKQSIALTTALLQLARGRKAKQMDFVTLSARSIIEEVVDMHKAQLAHKPIDIQFNFQNELYINTSEAAFTVVISNLINNAFKYTAEGTVTISIFDSTIFVEDSGPGLSEEEIKQVFKRHYRSSSAKGKGSGLGLSIVERLCEASNWKITMENVKKGGLIVKLDVANSLIQQTVDQHHGHHSVL